MFYGCVVGRTQHHVSLSCPKEEEKDFFRRQLILFVAFALFRGLRRWNVNRNLDFEQSNEGARTKSCRLVGDRAKFLRLQEALEEN